jgi:pilus assembly protein CpaE
MGKELKIILAGQNRAEVASLAQTIRANPAWSLSVPDTQTGAHPLPLSANVDGTDVLILCLQDGDGDELRTLAARPAGKRPPLLIVGAIEDTAVMRLAMQAGARDFLTPPVSAPELREALNRIQQESSSGSHALDSRLVAVINGKGGSGASVVASNVAHVLAILGAGPVALIDGDLQFGAIPQYFDLTGRDGLLKAVKSVDELDATALDGYMLKHRSGLHLLSCNQEGLALYGAEEIVEADMRIKRLLGMLKETYTQLVVDLPRQVDRMTGAVLQQADDILIVMQQSLVQIRDVQRLLLFLRELAVQPARIHVVLNRYDKNMPVNPGDIEKSLHQPCFITLPNDFQVVSQSTNLGIPLFEYKRGAPITKAMVELAGKLSARPLVAPKGGLLSWLKG